MCGMCVEVEGVRLPISARVSKAVFYNVEGERLPTSANRRQVASRPPTGPPPDTDTVHILEVCKE